MVFLAPSELVRLSVSKKWDCSIPGQRLGGYSALGILLHDTDCTENSMEKPTSAQSEPPAVKRKRGTPRKSDTVAAQAAASGIGAPPMKRRRGRPRKVDLLTEQVAASGFGGPPVKRKRGRPRKADVQAAQVAASGIGATAAKRKRGRPRKADISGTEDGSVSYSDSDESLSQHSSDSNSNSSSDSDHDDHQAILNRTESFQLNRSSVIDIDDRGQERPNPSESSEPNLSSDEDDHSSDEDFDYREGRTRPEKKKKRSRSGVILQYKEPASGVICHWCRQRSERVHVQCSLCMIKFCPPCLRNRHGEKIKEKMDSGARWVCPRCRDGCGEGCENCCNCGPCRRTQGKPPTGLLASTARKAGFSNVHDYLINLVTGESAEVIAMRKEGRGWTEATEAVCPAVEESPIPPWGMKKMRTPMILGYLLSRYRKGRENAMATEVTKASEPESLEHEKQDSCTINLQACQNATASEVTKASEPESSLLEREKQDSCTINLQACQNAMASEVTKASEPESPLLEREKQDSCTINLQASQISSSPSNESESPPLMSMEAGGTDGPVPRRKRSPRNTAIRKEERDREEVEHNRRPDVHVSHTECAGDDQGGLPDLNVRCEEEAFQIPDLNSPFITSTGDTISIDSGQEITGATMCRESGSIPLSAESTESNFSVRTLGTSTNEAEAATNIQVKSAAPTLVRGDEFRTKLDLVLQRPFSSEQLKEMWDHFMFHRPSQQEEHTCHGSSKEEADELLCDYFADLYEQLARTFSAVEKLKLLRAFFFWLQHSSMEGTFQPWVTDGEDDQFGGCTPINLSDSQVIDRLLAIDNIFSLA